MLTTEYQKATKSGPNGNCLEARWKKATASGAGDCVEARTEGVVQVRDSKDKDGPVLSYTPAEWDAFLDGVRKGEFDLPAGVS
jgi:hypothetical protein